MEWFKFIKGDTENLKGNVFVYGEIKEKDKSDENSLTSLEEDSFFHLLQSIFFPRKFVVFFATDKKERMEEELRRKGVLEDIVEKDSNKHYDSFKKIYVASFITFSEQGIKEEDEDIIYVGKYKGVVNCINVIQGVINIYFSKFYEKVKLNINEKLDVLSEEEMEDRMIKKIFDDYVNPMKDAVRNNDVNRFENLKKGLTNLSKACGFIFEISPLCNHIRKGDDKVVELYVKKMVASHFGDEEKAVKYKKEIEKSLRNKL